ncbi:MAG: hypothetical protein D6685_16595 [Bacteroidetes bacterium]|nr:MAG: hypothetical protein D6685_16595 [Bacteroidota bacterium]
MVAEKEQFLRVGGPLDYQIAPTHFPANRHHDGHIPFGHALDLEHATRAEVVLERVQSHVDTRGLALQINGHPWLPVPPPAGVPRPATDYMFHDYPVVPVPLEYLHAGPGNTFKLKVDSTQRWNWPQNIFYGVLLRIYYAPETFDLQVRVEGLSPGDSLAANQKLTLATPTPEAIARVDYVGLYHDINWRGDGIFRQWQYHFHKGKIRNHLGSATAPPFEVHWATDWVPDQPREIQVAARVTDHQGLVHITPAISGLRLHRDHRVELALPYRQPANWVTREDSLISYVAVHSNPVHVEALQLAWRSWSPCYARGVFINGVRVFDHEAPCYDYAEHLLEIEEPTFLQHGENVISTGKTPLIDGQMVHGMEVQWPGIMLKVRTRPPDQPAVRIEEGTYAGRPHFIVHTPSATYYYDRAGGGLSRLIDTDGRDWIGFWPIPWDTYPASAASAYRGIPNLVFGSDEGGAGHPGHDQCESERLEGQRIRSTSRQGRWQWTWHFFADHARLDIERTDPNHAYWFLYEGTPGGVYEPARQYMGTDQGGPLRIQPDFFAGDKRFDIWRWAYFGHEEARQVLFVAQHQPDTLSDAFAYLGNTPAGLHAPDGMVIFGFGRQDGAIPLMTERRTFFVGLHEAVRDADAHTRLGAYIRTLLRLHSDQD